MKRTVFRKSQRRAVQFIHRLALGIFVENWLTVCIAKSAQLRLEVQRCQRTGNPIAVILHFGEYALFAQDQIIKVFSIRRAYIVSRLARKGNDIQLPVLGTVVPKDDRGVNFLADRLVYSGGYLSHDVKFRIG